MTRRDRFLNRIMTFASFCHTCVFSGLRILYRLQGRSRHLKRRSFQHRSATDMNAEKKRIEAYILAAARKSGVPIPSGETLHEEPDFRFNDEIPALGILNVPENLTQSFERFELSPDLGPELSCGLEGNSDAPTPRQGIRTAPCARANSKRLCCIYQRFMMLGLVNLLFMCWLSKCHHLRNGYGEALKRLRLPFSI